MALNNGHTGKWFLTKVGYHFRIGTGIHVLDDTAVYFR